MYVYVCGYVWMHVCIHLHTTYSYIHTYIHRSTAAVDDLEAHGANLLGSLSSQRERLKSAHKKVLDVMNTLGVSNSLIRVIERRQTMDLVWMAVGQ